MAIEAELADGTILEFPDGTDQNVIDRTVKRHVVESLATSRADTKAAPKAAPKVQTREDAIKAKAREQVAADASRRDSRIGSGFLGDVADFGTAAKASVANTFGIGPHVQAGISALKDGVSYDDALTYWREVSKAERDQSVPGDVAGALVGGGGAVKAGGMALNALGKVAPAAGNVISRAVNLQRGQKAANAARIVGVGGAAGGAQAAGEGSDVTTGVGLGAAASGLGAGAINATRGVLRQIGRPFSGNVGKAARETITEDVDALAKRQAEMSQATGNNVPLYAALRDRDAQNVTQQLLKDSPDANEIAKKHTASYVKDFADRMVQHVTNAAGRAGVRRISAPSELALLRDQTADQLMAPIEGKKLDLTQLPVEDLERKFTQTLGTRIKSIGPRIEKAIGEATDAELKALGITPQNRNTVTQMTLSWLRNPVDVTVREMESLRRMLNGAAQGSARAGNMVDAEAFRNASQAVRDFVSDVYPAYGDMVDTYAAQSRMMEGFDAARKGTRLTDITDTNDLANLGTAEGRLGMKLGELYRQREAVAASPSAAINMAREFANEGALTRQPGNLAQSGTVTENVGPQSARELADASDVEVRGVDRMLQAGGVDATTLTDKALDSPENILYGVAALNPNAMIGAKARFLGKLTGLLPTGFSKDVAENLTDMLFSRDPAQTQRALNAMRRVGITEQVMSTQLLPTVMGAAGARNQGGATPAQQPQAAPEPAPEPQAAVEDQDFEDLASRMEQVESGGNQGAVSPKGAIGVMQVMPGTAPEAAELAGVPFDEERYKTDEDYNRTLGRAYLKEMLNQFDGDLTAAVAAYNAGPTAVRRAIARGGNWVALLPDETQDYIQKVLG